ncbi:MAG TPA: hypothetical protein PKY67_09710 [Nitrosomonas sp.]|nr:hypothetical protein [Nitrosomonas sp.]
MAQHIDMLDKQLRNAVVEHLVVCKRLDRVKIPFIGSLLQIAGFSGKFVKLHNSISQVRQKQPCPGCEPLLLQRNGNSISKPVHLLRHQTDIHRRLGTLYAAIFKTIASMVGW